MKGFASVFAVLYVALAVALPTRNVSNSTLPITHLKPIEAEPASDELWNEAVCKGGKLVRLMEADNAGAGQLVTPPTDSLQSPYTDFPAEFEKWGYTSGDDNDKETLGYEYYGLQEMLDGLGVSKNDEDWKYKVTRHGDVRSPTLNEDTYKVNDKDYRLTGGKYHIVINKKEGFMMHTNLLGVKKSAQYRRPPVTEFPENMLHRSSDVTWGMWSVEEGDNALKHFASVQVTNPTTLKLIRRAIDNIGESTDLPGWPGYVFPTDTPEGKALLASPNGLGVAYTLAQHKNELGLQTIRNIRVFHLNSNFDEQLQYLCNAVYFEVAPVDSPEDEPEVNHHP